MDIIFWILHIVAVCTFWPALFITIPLHIIANVEKGKK